MTSKKKYDEAFFFLNNQYSCIIDINEFSFVPNLCTPKVPTSKFY